MKKIKDRLIGFTIGLSLVVALAIGQDWYQATGKPVQRSLLNSADLRTEFASIQSDIADKLPALTGNANKFVRVNSTGTALETADPVFNFATTAAEVTAGVTIVNANYEEGHVYRYGSNTSPGVTNMTAAIQAAVDVAAAKPEGRVIFPPERMMISTTIAVVGTEITLSGSMGSTLVWTGATTDNALEFGDGTTTTLGLVVDTLNLEDTTAGTGTGPDSGGSGSSALVLLNYTTRSQFNNFRVYGNSLKSQGYGVIIERSWQNTFTHFRCNNLDICVSASDNSDGANGIVWLNPSVETFNTAGFSVAAGTFVNQWSWFGGTIQGGSSQDANGIDVRQGQSELFIAGTYFEDNNYDIYLSHNGSQEHGVTITGAYFITGDSAGAPPDAHIYHDAFNTWLSISDSVFQSRDGVYFADCGATPPASNCRYIGRNNTSPLVDEIETTSPSSNFAYYDRISGAGHFQFLGSQFQFQGALLTTPQTFAAADSTPSVAGSNVFYTDSGVLTISDFDDPVAGQAIHVISKGIVTFDTTASGLIGSSVDIVTANGDVTTWVYDGNSAQWRLTGYVDTSADNSTGA